MDATMRSLRTMNVGLAVPRRDTVVVVVVRVIAFGFSASAACAVETVITGCWAVTAVTPPKSTIKSRATADTKTRVPMMDPGLRTVASGRDTSKPGRRDHCVLRYRMTRDPTPGEVVSGASRGPPSIPRRSRQASPAAPLSGSAPPAPSPPSPQSPCCTPGCPPEWRRPVPRTPGTHERT